MNRLLDEQAVVDVVDFECGEWRGLAKTIVEKIDQLPSAQPEKHNPENDLPTDGCEVLCIVQAGAVHEMRLLMSYLPEVGWIPSDMDITDFTVLRWYDLPE